MSDEGATTRKVIAMHTTFDAIRDEITTATVYEERYCLGYLYTVNVETEHTFNSFEYDTMAEALRAAHSMVPPVFPTNGGVPAFDRSA